jgi:hypothetical protein
MPNDDEPLKFDLPALSKPEELTSADLDPRQLAARMRGLELRVLALEQAGLQAELRRQEAGAEFLRKMQTTQPGADMAPQLAQIEAATARTRKALAELERKNKRHKGIRRKP